MGYFRGTLILWFLFFKNKNQKFVWLTPFWTDPQITNPMRITHYTVLLYFPSLPLSLSGNSGLMAYKYTPYGPVEEVIPYLIRRANENRGMLDGAVRERALISTEIKRRLMDRNKN